MGKKKFIIVAIIIGVLILFGFKVRTIFVDLECYENGREAVYARRYEGGEIDEYVGFGYRISYYYPQYNEDDYDDDYGFSSDWEWFWEY